MSRVIWTSEMDSALREMRERNVPIYECSEAIGVSYPVAWARCRVLNLSQRRNRGRVTGRSLVNQSGYDLKQPMESMK